MMGQMVAIFVLNFSLEITFLVIIRISNTIKRCKNENDRYGKYDKRKI